MKIYINKNEKEDYTSYYTTCKVKDTDDKYYLSIQFTKGATPQTDKVDVTDGFFSAYASKKGIQPKLVVMSFEDIGTNFDEKETKQVQQMSTKTKTDPYQQMHDKIEDEFESSLPF